MIAKLLGLWKEILLGVLAIAIIFLIGRLIKKPTEVIKTETVTKTITKVETKIQYVTVTKAANKVTARKEIRDLVRPDGTKEHIVIQEDSVDKSTTQQNQITKDTANTQETLKEVRKTVEKYTSSILLGINYNFEPLNPVFTYTDPSKIQLLAGYRILGPIFVTAGTTGNFKTTSIGILVEF